MQYADWNTIHCNLWKNGALTEAMSLVLRACVRGQLNILVSANAGAGRSELVEALCAGIGADASKSARIISDCAELDPTKLLQVMHKDRPGSILTVCAGSPAGGLLQLESLVRKADPTLSLRAAKELTSSAIDLILQTEHMQDGTWFAVTEPAWRILEMSEPIRVTDKEEYFSEEYQRGEGYYALSRIFVFDAAASDHIGSGLPPMFLDQLELAGIPVQLWWFAGLTGPNPPARKALSQEQWGIFDNPPLEPQVSVAFAKRAIKAGEIIDPAAFEIRKVAASMAPPGRELYLAIEGAKAKVDLAAGAPIKRSDIDS